jgi:predicted O-methyltransferase YrrM
VTPPLTPVAGAIQTARVDDIDRLLAAVKDRARGWMPLPVYRRLYESAAQAGGGTFVEIGTFCGAATVAMALGARSAGTPFEIITADLLRPGVGLEGDKPEDRIAALSRTLSAFDIERQVRFVHGDTETLVSTTDPREIRLLLLDGGGRIETDLALLWHRLAPGAEIVIDDVDGHVFVDRGLGMARINQKHRISNLLARTFVAAGMLVEGDRLESTGWYRKGEAAPSPEQIRLMALPAYHQLIRIEISEREIGLPRAIARAIAARAPWLRRAYRRFRPSTPAETARR